MLLRSDRAQGYIRVDWYTPDGLATWGDGRLTILGTDGYIELRKYIDIAGRPGTDHLFLVDKQATRYIDCSDAELPYSANLIADVLDRTETAMPQAHCFKVMELALKAQAMATGWATCDEPPGSCRGDRRRHRCGPCRGICENAALYQVAVVCDLDAARAAKVARQRAPRSRLRTTPCCAATTSN